MNPASKDLLNWLDTSGLFTFGTDLFIGSMPDVPDECICIYDSGGGRPFPDASRVDEFPRVMIEVRGKINQYEESYALCRSITTALHGKHNVTIGGTRYISVFQVSEPINLGQDDRGRYKWSINFEINRTE